MHPTRAVNRDILTIANSVRMPSTRKYRIGSLSRNLPPFGNIDDDYIEPAIQTLASEIYERLYCRLANESIPMESSKPAVVRDFVGTLSSANCGNGTWDPGWRIVEAEAAAVGVSKYDLTMWAPTTGVRIPDRMPKVGDRCRVHVPKEVIGLYPGFYVALGDADAPDQAATDPSSTCLVRTYWNLLSDAAETLVRLVTARLNGAAIPFKLKVLRDPLSYRVATSAVLFVDRGYLPSALPHISEIYQALAPDLREEVPLMTLKLANGLGLAEEPGNGLSFGQHRCLLVARGVVQAGLRQRYSIRTVVEMVTRVFEDDGVDPSQPFLSFSDSSDAYIKMRRTIAARV